MIQFISHEFYPDDQYVKESCTLTVDGAQRFTYVRKISKNGALWWSCINASVNFNGKKKYIDSIEWDSNFLAKDIEAFLEARSWDNAYAHRSKADVLVSAPFKAQAPLQYETQKEPDQMSFLDQCPF